MFLYHWVTGSDSDDPKIKCSIQYSQVAYLFNRYRTLTFNIKHYRSFGFTGSESDTRDPMDTSGDPELHISYHRPYRKDKI